MTLKTQDLGEKVRDFGVESRSGDVDQRESGLEDCHRASEDEWRARLRESDEQWNYRIRVLKELMNNHLLAMEGEVSPEASPVSPSTRAARSPSMVRGFLGRSSSFRPNSHGMSLDQDSFLTFDSTTDWDIDDEYDSGDDEEDEVIEESVRQNADEEEQMYSAPTWDSNEGSEDEERQLQAIKKKMLEIIDEIKGMFKEWRREDAARRAAESTVLDRSLPVRCSPMPTVRPNFQGINPEPISLPTFDSAATYRDVIDDGKEEGDWLNDNGDWLNDENEEKVGSTADKIELEKEDENVEDEVIEEGLRRNADEKEAKTKSLVHDELCAALENGDDQYCWESQNDDSFTVIRDMCSEQLGRRGWPAIVESKPSHRTSACSQQSYPQQQSISLEPVANPKSSFTSYTLQIRTPIQFSSSKLSQVSSPQQFAHGLPLRLQFVGGMNSFHLQAPILEWFCWLEEYTSGVDEMGNGGLFDKGMKSDKLERRGLSIDKVRLTKFMRLSFDLGGEEELETKGVGDIVDEGELDMAIFGTPLQHQVGEFYSLVCFLQLYPCANYVCKDCDGNIFDHRKNTDYENELREAHKVFDKIQIGFEKNLTMEMNVLVFDLGGGLIFCVVFISTARLIYDENFNSREVQLDVVESEANTENESETIRPLPWHSSYLAWHFNFSRMLIFVMMLGLVSNVISDKSDSLRNRKREVIEICVVERTQKTEPCDGAQAMLEDSQLGKMEDRWMTLALSYKGKAVQEQECTSLCNLVKQQLDENMAIVQVSKQLHHSSGMPDSGKFAWSGKFKGPSNRDKLWKALILKKTPSLELMKVDPSIAEKKVGIFDPGGGVAVVDVHPLSVIAANILMLLKFTLSV